MSPCLSSIYFATVSQHIDMAMGAACCLLVNVIFLAFFFGKLFSFDALELIRSIEIMKTFRIVAVEQQFATMKYDIITVYMNCIVVIASTIVGYHQSPSPPPPPPSPAPTPMVSC